MTCNNCQNIFEGKHCNNCGQKATVGNLNLKALFNEAWHSITHTDNGILKLIKDLFLKPKQVYLGYFAGQRKTYFSPVTFFLISIAMMLFIGLQIFAYEDYVVNMRDEFGKYSLIGTKFKTIIILPFVTFFTWLISRKQFNLAKNIVFWLFLFGLTFVIKIIVTPFYFLLIEFKEVIDFVITYVQFIFIFIHLILVFGNKNWLKIVYCFLLLNFLMIADYIVSGYLLFDDKLFEQTNSKNFYDLIISSYGF